MSEIEKLREARNCRTVTYTEFLGYYNKKNKNICYGFVEGKDDPSYYKNMIKNQLPKPYEIKLYKCRSKKLVKETYGCFNWKSFSKEQIVFFMDKDLSTVLEDKNIIIDNNVYVTDKYSIENDIIDKEIIGDTLELMGLDTNEQELIDHISELFEGQKRRFEEIMLPVMANIIFWKKKDIKKACYNNIKIKELIEIKEGEIYCKLQKEGMCKNIYDKSHIDFSLYDEKEISDIEKEISDIQSEIIRGKYLVSFFTLFCKDIKQNSSKFNLKFIKGQQIGDKDVMTLIAPRARITNSLDLFIRKTLLVHIKINNSLSVKGEES